MASSDDHPSGAPVKDQEAEDILKSIQQVAIDSEGKVFKYILIEAKLRTERRKYVRGFERHDYHADIFDEFEAAVKKLLPRGSIKCLGGGRIDNKKDSILIYGYSQGYGRAKHEDTAELVQSAFPDKKVTWTNDGY